MYTHICIHNVYYTYLYIYMCFIRNYNSMSFLKIVKVYNIYICVQMCVVVCVFAFTNESNTISNQL